MNEIVLQTILGAEKKGTLTLFREKESRKIQIFYGALLLEIVPTDSDHISYRTAAGRLYNAGLKREILAKVFNVNRRTLQSWGKALLLDDKEEAVRILSGQKSRKLTPEIIQFAKVRFFNIYPNKNCYSYSQEIRKEIKEVFGLTLSSESLRKYFKNWKDEIYLIATDKLDESNLESHSVCDCEVSNNNLKPTITKDFGQIEGNNNRKYDVSNIQYSKFVRHAGVLLFSLFLEKISNAFGENGGILKQWLTMFFLEAVNIEQSKYLDFNSLTNLLGDTIRRPQVQRQKLNQLANEDVFNRLFKLNGELCDVDNVSDFYYDPHTKQYTGTQKILKGWCGSLGHPDKALHSDLSTHQLDSLCLWCIQTII